MTVGAEIFVVCTGNVCRSPMTERLLRSGLRRQWGASSADVLVHSAGTRALVGEPMHELTANLVTSLGGDSSDFAARQVDARMTRAATVVLALTRDHRVPVVEGHPPAARVTFTLREFAPLADVPTRDVAGDSLAERVHAMTALAVSRRGLLPPARSAEDNVTDPYGRDLRAHQVSTDEIVPAVTTLLRFTAPAR